MGGGNYEDRIFTLSDYCSSFLDAYMCVCVCVCVYQPAPSPSGNPNLSCDVTSSIHFGRMSGRLSVTVKDTLKEKALTTLDEVGADPQASFFALYIVTQFELHEHPLYKVVQI